MAYVERNCVFEIQGKKFESGGACYDGQYARAYMSSDMKAVGTWQGEKLGDAKIVSCWQTPRSNLSYQSYQVEAMIDGVLYSGRTAGGGMAWNGKRKAKQPHPGTWSRHH